MRKGVSEMAQATKHIAVITVLYLLACMTISVAKSAETEPGEYTAFIECKGVTCEFFLNGFPIPLADVGSTYYLQKGKNKLVCKTKNFDSKTKSKFKVSLQTEGMEPEKVVWEKEVKPDQELYQYSFTLPNFPWTMPWQDAEEIQKLSEEDRKNIKNKTLKLMEVFSAGNEKRMKQVMPQISLRFSADSKTMGRPKEQLLDQFFTFYKILWGPENRANIQLTQEGDLQVRKSPYNDKVVYVQKREGGLLIRIDSDLSAEDNMPFHRKYLRFIKVDHKWRIY